IIGTGSELQIAVEARRVLEGEGVPTRVVSMPCMDWFAAQDQGYRDSVLPPSHRARVSVEAGIAMPWHRWVGDAGEIAILSASANATNQNAWIDLMKKDLAANHPNITLVDVVYGNDDDQKSFQETQGLLQAYPDLKGIISPTTVGIAAAGKAMTDEKLCDKVKVSGLGLPDEMKDYTLSGCAPKFALWSFTDLGYLAFYA
ncbi:MAG: substrate-binding domain-containing protein, partial [Gammaproteobacteria bacterium]